MSRAVVDLPQPDSPTMPSVSPRRTVRVTSSTACTVPNPFAKTPCFTGKCFVRCSTSTIGSAVGVLRLRLPSARLGAPPTPAASPPPTGGTHPSGRPRAGAGSAGRPGRARTRSGSEDGTRTRWGGFTRDGGAPSIETSDSRRASIVGIEPSRPHVYGCCGARKISRAGPCSAARPAYMTRTVSAVSETTPRSCVTRITPMSKSRLTSSMSSRICACTVTSSAVVGSSAMRSDGLFTSAIAIIARCRIPPENWCG